MADCKNMECPCRSNFANVLYHCYHCDRFIRQNRATGIILTTSNRTMTEDEPKTWKKSNYGR